MKKLLFLLVFLLSCGETRLSDTGIHTFDRGVLQVSPGVYVKGVSIRDKEDYPFSEVYFLVDSSGQPIAGASANYRQGKTNVYTATVMEPGMTLRAATLRDLKRQIDSLLVDEDYMDYVRLKSKFEKPELEQ